MWIAGGFCFTGGGMFSFITSYINYGADHICHDLSHMAFKEQNVESQPKNLRGKQGKARQGVKQIDPF